MTAKEGQRDCEWTNEHGPYTMRIVPTWQLDVESIFENNLGIKAVLRNSTSSRRVLCHDADRSGLIMGPRKYKGRLSANKFFVARGLGRYCGAVPSDLAVAQTLCCNLPSQTYHLVPLHDVKMPSNLFVLAPGRRSLIRTLPLYLAVSSCCPIAFAH